MGIIVNTMNEENTSSIVHYDVNQIKVGDFWLNHIKYRIVNCSIYHSIDYKIYLKVGVNSVSYFC